MKSRFKCPLCRENLDVRTMNDSYHPDKREVLVCCSVPACPASEGVFGTTEEIAVERLEREYPGPTTH